MVSEAGQRPPDATAARGVSWLPWGPANEIQIMERNLLPAANFAHASESIQTPAENAEAAKLLGNYYPTSAYCSESTVDRGGWQACLPALAKKLSAKSHKRRKHHKHHKRRHRHHKARRASGQKDMRSTADSGPHAPRQNVGTRVVIRFSWPDWA